ncbi:hypothetical protein B0J17DRAFT_716054 [Rhizoctonia solani]|nr:hypothetical protein B0J17DRAFT_716054 [Rhizoctonia solani]
MPPEILAEIFQYVVDGVYHPWNVRSSVSRLLFLCSICSCWRSVIFTKTSFWSRVPIGQDESSRRLTLLCLKHSQDSPINVVACAESQEPWNGEDVLDQHVHRIRSLLISTESTESNTHISSMLDLLLKNQIPPSLIHLAIEARRPDESLPAIPVYHPNFTKLCGQLHTLDLKGLMIDDWNDCSFAELRSLALGNSGLYSGMSDRFASTARHMRVMEYYSRDRWQKDEPSWPSFPTRAPMTIRIHHPSFDMFLYFLGLLPLQGIPNVLDIELALDRRSVTHPSEEPSLSAGIILLLPSLRKSRAIGSLILEDTQLKPFSGTVMRFMLEALPTLHTLTLEKFELTETTLRGFTRFVDPELPPDERVPFPAFEVLRLYYSRILDYDAFKLMVASHPVRRLHIWGCRLERDENDASCQRIASLRRWLCERVNEVYIIDP